jgi:hypothetical protein
MVIEMSDRRLNCPYCDESFTAGFDLILGLAIEALAAHIGFHHFGKTRNTSDDKMYNELVKVNPWLKEKETVYTFTSRE